LRIKVIISYDGSKFFGFQIQPNYLTVAGEIENGLKIIFNEKIKINIASRTDKGVHAINQVANFFIDSVIPLEALKDLLNKKIDKSVKSYWIDRKTQPTSMKNQF